MELISVHVPKCGGTSLRNALVAAKGESAIFFDNADRLLDPLSPINVDRAKYLSDFERVRDSAIQGKRVIHGHFCVRKYDSVKAPRFTVLREPVDRLISHYLFWGHLEPHGHSLHDRFLAEKPSVVEFARMPAFRNFYRDVIFRDVDMSMFDFVGRVENMEEAVAELEQLTGWEISLEKTNINHCEHCRERKGEMLETRQIVSCLRDILAEEIIFYEKNARPN